MGQPIFTSADAARITLLGVIEERADEIHVRIDAKSADGSTFGTRELSAPAGQCASLRAPIVLVLTLFLERGDDPLGSEPDLRFGFGASVAVASTPLPRATFAVGPALSTELGDVVRLQLDAAYWVPVSIETRRRVGAKLEAFSGSLRVCLRVWGASDFALRTCVSGEFGALIARPLNLEGPERQVRLLAQGALELRAETYLGGVARIDAAVGPLLSFSRPSVSYTRADGANMAVYRPDLGGIIFQVTFIILGS